VAAVYAMGDYFALQAGEEMLEAKTVILAGGVVQGKLLPGEEKMVGRGVSYCATCDATLYRGKTTAVVGYSEREEAEAAFLSEVCARVLYFHVYKEETNLPASVQVIRETVRGIEKDGEKKLVKTAENGYAVDGVFVLREAVAPGQLVPGLAVDGSHVAVNRKMEASIPGCFACGDIAGTPYQYIKAAGEGNVAALSAVSYLDQLKQAKA
jgi:thioredoxin reductase (NADPH)